jgi:hypothetical protein
MNQQSTLRHSFTRILLCVPVAGILALPAFAAGDAQPAPVRYGWGSAVAWGYNEYGQTTVPTDLGTVIQVAAGGSHTVALQSDGKVRAWGRNLNGQTTVPSSTDVVTQVAAGFYHTVVISATAGELASHIMDQAAANTELDAQVTSLQADLLVKTDELSDCEADKTGLQEDLLIKTTELSDCETEKAAALARGASRARGDVNDDSAIGQQDLLRILLHWGPHSAEDNSARMKDLHKSIRASLKEIRRMRR